MQFSQVYFANLFTFSRANLEFSRDFHDFSVRFSKMASNIGWSLDLLLGGYIARQGAVREGRMGRGFSPRGGSIEEAEDCPCQPFPSLSLVLHITWLFPRRSARLRLSLFRRDAVAWAVCWPWSNQSIGSSTREDKTYPGEVIAGKPYPLSSGGDSGGFRRLRFLDGDSTVVSAFSLS